MKTKAIKKLKLLLMALTLSSISSQVHAQDVLSTYIGMAQKQVPGFSKFSAAAGEAFYFKERETSKGTTMSCATCHSKDPKSSGRTPQGKEIKPLAPSIQSDRFTDFKKVEKWFKRNCNDVYERECSTEEKGNFVSYLKSIQ